MEVVSRREAQAYALEEVLSSPEIETYVHYQPSRRTHWLLGRLAAKRALAAAIGEVSGKKFSLPDIEIVTRLHARPTFRIAGADLADGIALSLSHSSGHAIAAVSSIEREGFIGVDIERERTFSPRVLRSFLTASEYERYETESDREKAAYATLLWCLKEAYLKAKGVGLLMHPRKVEVRLEQGKEPSATFFEDGREVAVRAQWFFGPHRLIKACVYIQDGAIPR